MSTNPPPVAPPTVAVAVATTAVALKAGWGKREVITTFCSVGFPLTLKKILIFHGVHRAGEGETARVSVSIQKNMYIPNPSQLNW